MSCPWIITSYVTVGGKNMLPGCHILKVAKKECRHEHHLNGLLCLQEKQLPCPWPKKTLTEHHTPQPRFMLHRNNLPRPLLSSGFTFLILAQPSAGALSQLWFLLSSLVLHFHGVLISRWPLFYQPSPSKTHDSTSVLKQQRTEPTLSTRGPAFTIWIHIANLFNYFSCDTVHKTLTSLAALFLGLFPEAGNIKQDGLN